MGYMVHHAIIVTAWDEVQGRFHRDKAVQLFKGDNAVITPLISSVVNDYWTFAIFPDGSKEGWDVSDRFDMLRAGYIDWLKKKEVPCQSWVHVQYGDDDDENKILDCSE